MRAQLNMETYFENLAKIQNQDVLLVCDRGACDTFAYCSPEVREQVMASQNWTMDFLNHDRYDKIIHMVTAAKGAENYYGFENKARSENIQEGIDLDNKIQEVWFTSPSYVIVDNSDNVFKKKVSRVFNEIGDMLSLPTEKFVKKFLLKDFFSPKDFPKGIFHTNYRENITYLVKNKTGVFSFIIERRFNHTKKCIRTHKTRYISDTIEKRIETSKQLSKELYMSFYQQREKSKREVQKDVYSFRMVDNEHVFLYRIENFKLEEGSFSILHLTTDIHKKSRKLPHFLSIDKEVTNNPEFFSHKIAKRKIESLNNLEIL